MIQSPRIFLLGPTASGKTDLTKFCFDNFKLELINVDSAQIYKGFNIGSAKPSTSDLSLYPHHLVDIIEPDKTYSVSHFKMDVEEICSKADTSNKTPFLTGGTMMYFNALEYPLDNLPQTSPATRLIVKKELEQGGLVLLHEKLKKIDPVAAKNIKSTDTQRVLRAIEVFYESGKPITSFYQKNNDYKIPEYPLLKLGLYPEDRATLHHAIERRVEKMIGEGLVREVEGILSRYPKLNDDFSSLRSVGYKQTYLYLKGKLSYTELKDRIIFSTRQLAKRQLTWMRKMQNLELFNPYDKKLTSKVKERILRFLKRP